MDSNRPSFSLAAGDALRDRAARVTERAAQRGTPRRRYLAQQRVKLAARLVPTLALFSVVSGAAALADLFAPNMGPPSRTAVVIQATMAVFLAGAALSVPLARKRLDVLVVVASGSAMLAVLGWSAVAYETGGAASPFVTMIPLVLAAFTGLLALPPRATLVVSAFAYACLFVAGPTALFAHVLVLGGGAGGYAIARVRQRASLRAFLRAERAGAAIARIKRMHDELVVIEKLEALRVLVGGMAHELNNALTVSSASNQSALRSLDADADGAASAAKSAIQRSDGGLARIKRTVDRLRRFAMAAEGTLEPADVGAMLDFALESAIGRARSGVIIDREYDPGVGAIDCHVAALAEALFQIARNAVEAMPSGGRIRAKVRAVHDRVILAVADEGGGIPPEQLAKVFDPFYSRAAGSSRAGAQKAGLGLSAVYGLVSALGGSVEVKSKVGEGTEVSIVMPRKTTPTKPPPRT